MEPHHRVVVADPFVGAAPDHGADPAEAVARRLRDAGVEVIFVGGGLGPVEVAEVALQEDAGAVALAVHPAPAAANAAAAGFAEAVTAALADRGMGHVVVAVDDGTDPHFLGCLRLD